MNALDFAFGVLSNAWSERAGGKSALLALLILFAVMKGRKRRLEILSCVTKMSDSSFFSSIRTLVRRGYLQSSMDNQGTFYELTNRGLCVIANILKVEESFKK